MIPLQNEWTVFKGGSAFNHYLKEFQQEFPRTAYILPITDDGGSSREIGRVFGGPSIGDLRSTLTRLSDESTPEAMGVKKLLEHRLSKDDAEAAASEWHAFLEDRHPLYQPLSSKYRGLVRAFLCKFEEERLHRISSQFDLRNGSIGNFFFTGTRMALGSLETTIFMYSSVAQISPTTHVIPIIDSNDRYGIGVKLENQEKLIGQSLISHSNKEKLPSPIAELFYVDQMHHAIQPDPHPDVTHHIRSSQGMIYGTGSFWTSIVPSLVLKGVGESIASLNGPKVLLLNCCLDRETANLSGLTFVRHLVNSLNRYGTLPNSPKDYLTHLFIVSGSDILVEKEAIEKLGIQVHTLPKDEHAFFYAHGKKHPVYSKKALIQSLRGLRNG